MTGDRARCVLMSGIKVQTELVSVAFLPKTTCQMTSSSADSHGGEIQTQIQCLDTNYFHSPHVLKENVHKVVGNAGILFPSTATHKRRGERTGKERQSK